jgi:predicted ribonuclease YlaK
MLQMNGDDCILNSVLKLKEKNDTEVALLTFDIGMRLKASSLDILAPILDQNVINKFFQI